MIAAIVLALVFSAIVTGVIYWITRHPKAQPSAPPKWRVGPTIQSAPIPLAPNPIAGLKHPMIPSRSQRIGAVAIADPNPSQDALLIQAMTLHAMMTPGSHVHPPMPNFPEPVRPDPPPTEIPPTPPTSDPPATEPTPAPSEGSVTFDSTPAPQSFSYDSGPSSYDSGGSFSSDSGSSGGGDSGGGGD